MPQLLTSYAPLRRRSIRSEMRRLQAAQEEVDALWQSEVEAYEGKRNDDDGKTAGGDGNEGKTCGDRNYANRTGTVTRPNLFPYHDALYPLLDVYYHLDPDRDDLYRYDDVDDGDGAGGGGIVPPSPVYDTSRRSAPPPHLGIVEANVPGYLPNSSHAVYASLLPRHRCRDRVWRYLVIRPPADDDDDDDDDADYDASAENSESTTSDGREGERPPPPPPPGMERDDFDFLLEWEGELWNEGEVIVEAAAAATTTSAEEESGRRRPRKRLTWQRRRGHREREQEERLCPHFRRYGPDRLPPDASGRADVLIRVLRHACSDLQRDHRLGRAAMLLMSELRCFDDDDDGDDEIHACDGDGGDGGDNLDGYGGGGGGGADRLRRLLSVLASEYVGGCDWNCHVRFLDGQQQQQQQQQLGGGNVDHDHDHDDSDGDSGSDSDDEDGDGGGGGRGSDAPNHYCDDWKNLLRTLSTVFSNGITFVTEAHAEAAGAFVLKEFDGASDAAAVMDETYFEGGVFAEEEEEEEEEEDGVGDGSKAVGGSAADSNGGGGGKPQHPSAKALLKQNLFYFNNTSGGFGFGGGDGQAGAAAGDGAGQQGVRTPPESFRLSMVYAIVDGLGWHASRDRTRLQVLAGRGDAEGGEDESISGPAADLLLRRTADSYLNCIRALVAIGESTVRRLPPNSRTMSLGGALVRALVLASVDHDPAKVPNSGYIGKCIADADAKSLISPTRYADGITNADTLRSFNGAAPAPSDGKDAIVRHILDSSPHQDVQDVIKGLFLRDLVDTKVSGCGYGDVLVWCRLPVVPLDPLLFDHVSNYPDIDQDTGEWGVDEDDHALSGHQLAARYDFTLLMMQRAWQAPWTPRSHRSFSYHHRQAVVTLALCAQRVGVPNELVMIVNSFLPRSWWPDDRRRCWCHDCQLNSLSELLRTKVISREGASLHLQEKQITTAAPTKHMPAPATMHNISLMRPLPNQAKTSTPGVIFDCDCKVAMYCSKEHRKYLWQDGHKRACGTPPFRIPGIDEELLCQEVFGTTSADLTDIGSGIEEEEEIDEDGDDDDGSWESIDTDEDDFGPPELKTRTEVIYKFFDNKAYKIQEVERPALGGNH